MTRTTGADEAVRVAVAAFARRFDEKLEALFNFAAAGRSQLIEAMRYPVLAGGKRLRPFLVVQWCRLCGGQEEPTGLIDGQACGTNPPRGYVAPSVPRSIRGVAVKGQ